MDRFEPGWFGVTPSRLHMRVQEARRIIVSAARAKLRKLVEQTLAETSPSYVGTNIPLGTGLHVELVPGDRDAFQVVPLWPGMENQDIIRNDVTIWTFDVTALKAGHNQKLFVRAWSTTDKFGHPISPSARTVRDISKLTIDVDVVDVGWWDRIKVTLGWGITVLTGALALYGTWRKMHHPQPAQS